MRQSGINYIIRNDENEKRHDKECCENCKVLATIQRMALGKRNIKKNRTAPQNCFQIN